MMKRIMLLLAASALFLIAQANIAAATTFLGYQPDVPARFSEE